MNFVLQNKNISFILALVVAVGISGCTQKKNLDATATMPSTNSSQTKLLANKDQQIKELQAQIAAARSKQPQTIVKTVTKEVQVPGKVQLYPPNAKPGECYARVLTPAKYKTVTHKVLASEKTEKIKVIPAKYHMVDKTVLVKEAGTKIITIPAKYKTQTKKILVKEASQKLVTIPAVYKTVSEKVLVSPEHTKWKRGKGPIQKINDKTGEILCLIKVPAVYKTVKKRVVVKPATTKSIEIPAVYKTIKVRVVAEPATTKSIEIPAVYKTIKVRELLTPASEQKIVIPATYKTVTETIKTDDAVLQWRPIVCQTNINSELIYDIQKALKKRGFNPGPIDGDYGWRTEAAVKKFQESKGFATGALTQETIRALGI